MLVFLLFRCNFSNYSAKCWVLLAILTYPTLSISSQYFALCFDYCIVHRHTCCWSKTIFLLCLQYKCQTIITDVFLIFLYCRPNSPSFLILILLVLILLVSVFLCIVDFRLCFCLCFHLRLCFDFIFVFACVLSALLLFGWLFCCARL